MYHYQFYDKAAFIEAAPYFTLDDNICIGDYLLRYPEISDMVIELSNKNININVIAYIETIYDLVKYALENFVQEDCTFYINDYLSSIRVKTNHRDIAVKSVKINKEKYKGYIEIQKTDPRLGKFYSDKDVNVFNLLVNEYVIIYGEDKQFECYCWTGETYRRVNYYSFNSTYFGNIESMPHDPYQVIAMDSLANNQLTMLTGPAGSAKSTLSLAYLFSLLESDKISKITIFCNPSAARDSVHLGFYPGDRNSKLLDAQVGNFLRSKIGSNMIVEDLIEKEKLEILPMSDVRGFQSSPNSAIYLTEAQNFSVYLMKLALQRLDESSIMVVEGDNYQVDEDVFEGKNNGMSRLSEVFRGENYFGQVELKNIHRSKIAKKALEM